MQIQNNHIDGLDGRAFLPPSSLSTIFTPSAIAAAVAELSCAAEDRLGLAAAIRHGGVPTFAILVWMYQPDLVVPFRRKRCLDRLPLDEQTARQAAGDYEPTFVRLQREFMQYHFRCDQDVEIGREVLPFIRDLGPLTSGGFGDIQRLEIHSSLQDFAPHDVSYCPRAWLPLRLLHSRLSTARGRPTHLLRRASKLSVARRAPRPIPPEVYLLLALARARVRSDARA